MALPSTLLASRRSNKMRLQCTSHEDALHTPQHGYLGMTHGVTVRDHGSSWQELLDFGACVCAKDLTLLFLIAPHCPTALEASRGSPFCRFRRT